VGINEIAGFPPAGKSEKPGRIEDGAKPDTGKKCAAGGSIEAAADSSFEGRKQVEELLSKLPDQDMVRQEKVEEIREKIRDGFYDDPTIVERVAEFLTSILGR